MSLALFDLDNTLLGGDSDYLWGRFLIERGIVDAEYYERENRRFYDQYKAGTLDIREFLRFQLRPLAEHDMGQLRRWRDRYLREHIDPIILPAARTLIERHRQAGDLPVVITATNSFITAPIVERLGIEHLLATEPELHEGRYTGAVAGTPCFQGGKVERLEQWLTDHDADLRGSWFYSDSHNDLPLLSRVDNPVAVDPDDTLAAHARQRRWPIISLRAPS